MGNNQAQINYRRKHKDIVTVNMPLGERELWKAAAANAGRSTNAMILNAVRLLYVDGDCDIAGIQPPYGKTEF